MNNEISIKLFSNYHKSINTVFFQYNLFNCRTKKRQWTTTKISAFILKTWTNKKVKLPLFAVFSLSLSLSSLIIYLATIFWFCSNLYFWSELSWVELLLKSQYQKPQYNNNSNKKKLLVYKYQFLNKQTRLKKKIHSIECQILIYTHICLYLLKIYFRTDDKQS